jgi:amino acid transporter
LTNTTLEHRPTAVSISRPSSLLKKSQKLTLWPLVAATFFMVSGGTYGTEDIIGGSGFARGILILLITPILWSLPTSLMIGELASAMPEEGGYYAWVRRAMGNMWGFQEAWLSLVASIFDMAIYPTLFVTYLTKLFPYFSVGHRGVMVALAIVVVCAAMNIAGIRVVATTSVWLFVLLSIPFVAIAVLAPLHHGGFAHVATGGGTTNIGLIGGILICMWNYMGWDNATTVASEVNHPQRT